MGMNGLRRNSCRPPNLFTRGKKQFTTKTKHLMDIWSKWNIEKKKNVLSGCILRMTCVASLTSSSTSTFLLVSKAFASFIKMYTLLLFIRVVLGWFPAFNWDRNPWQAIRQVTDPYLNIFRGILPPLMGTIDLTPLIGFYLLQMLRSILMAPFANDPDVW